jgi:hypothetical protein
MHKLGQRVVRDWSGDALDRSVGWLKAANLRRDRQAGAGRSVGSQ